jgi:hypothetical protein
MVNAAFPLGKDWLAWNQNNMSEWRDLSTHTCSFRELAL